MYEGGKLDNTGIPPGAMKKPTNSLLTCLGGMEVKLNKLEAKVEQIACSQTEVLKRLDVVCQSMGTLEKDLARSRKDRGSRGAGGDLALFSEVRVLCGETVALLKNLQQEGKWQREKIEGIESSVSAADKLWGYVGEVFKSSKIVEFILKGIVPWRKQGLLYSGEEEADVPKPTGSQSPTSPTEEQQRDQLLEQAPLSVPLLSKEEGALHKQDPTKASVSAREPAVIVKPRTSDSSKRTSPLTLVTKPEQAKLGCQANPVAAAKPHKTLPPQPVSKTLKDSAEPVFPQPPPSLDVKNPAATAQEAALEAPQLVIDDCPPLPAPFEHRIVSAKQVPMGTYYAVKPNEVLGGGRFGQVHKCAELSSGLTLAAKIIKVKGMRERDEVKNEIGVMNQLNHVNLIQLYDAFESRTNLTLIMEYVEGGELFDRIVDENYHLTELDAIVFMRQICQGVQYLHQQYILHLDLKPENILCVNSTGNQIKIIDFGLARKYRPREKLKVNFGTPEFLAPEVVNYDFVSFPTDMWSVGVITYMLLSGLSPFLGDNDAETMSNILHANWDFDSDAFELVSEEAKDFISRLLIPAKCRLSATGCMKHTWLNNLEDKAKFHRVRLKSQVKLQRYLAAHRKWKKHFYVVTAANRLKRFRQDRPTNSV
uniref:Protein kinase domain-containing protein n=1 Tax=Esox lucius TaxID=8010 RepID=A0A6Q2WZY0_ESOLU